jgi:hypothetical protein
MRSVLRRDEIFLICKYADLSIISPHSTAFFSGAKGFSCALIVLVS